MGKDHRYAYLGMPFFFHPEVMPVRKAISGRTEKTVTKAAKRFGWGSYETSWEKLIERKGIDLIDIAIPNYTHKEIAIAAAKVGKNVLCEKP